MIWTALDLDLLLSNVLIRIHTLITDFLLDQNLNLLLFCSFWLLARGTFFDLFWYGLITALLTLQIININRLLSVLFELSFILL